MTNPFTSSLFGLAGVACASLFLSLAARAAPAAGTTQPLSPDDLPSVKDLPDPFLFRDGSRVKSPADWDRRRAEILDLVLTYEYGRVPPPPGNVTAAEDPGYEIPKLAGSNAKVAAPPEPATMPAGAVETKIKLTFGPGNKASTHVVLTVPPGKGPFPAIVKGDLCWGRVRPEIVAAVVGRGYIFAEFDRTEIAPDKDDRSIGVYPLYPDYDWGGAAAWAWGFARVNDYLVTRPDVDAKKLVVTGHSRGGKAAILAGALDERVALTVPNGSGCGGAGCYRFQAPKSEAIGDITKKLYYWFAPGFRQFVGKVDRLPIDQHEVKALVAPRALLSTDGLGDLWANPEGTQQSYVAAKPVFEFLGAGDRIGLHFREGKHEQNAEDFAALLDFADHLFAGKPSERKFDKLQFPDLPKVFTWSAPAKPEK